ncbi:CGNR zinc finger domain-containing protein [Catenuloplanes indicus]|uniref:Zinc finger CGNR domain-containing protein n=1 Tax=Catenuloplanes indicus TaxID=137267 RepID=A0AAE3VUW6_9ACTN|nr:CGNR zinc finger domain-containing protein [Catenuloplanes indicus]MDQ0364463.1 hypothetical protein [Catenuloplanes indicus]
MNTGRTAPAAAPGRLGTVQDFLNTLHVERGTDLLGAPATAYDWLPGNDLPPPGPRALDRLRALRRELRSRCGDGTPDDDLLARLADHAPLRFAPHPTGTIRLAPAEDGHRGILATLLTITYEAQRDGTWPRLKTCHHNGCRWVFYDHSRSRTATWCAMGICGNRTKVAAYRRRQSTPR